MLKLSELSKKSPRDFFKWVENLRNRDNLFVPSKCINDKNGTQLRMIRLKCLGLGSRGLRVPNPGE